MTLRFNRTARGIELSPSPSEIVGAFIQLITDLILRLSEVPSLFLTETGNARGTPSERFSKVFPDCQAYFEKEEIAFVEGHLQNILKIPGKVIAIVSDIINGMSESPEILAADTKDYANWLKSQDINVYARELANIDSARGQIEELLFEDHLMLGPVVLNCRTLRERLLKKIKDLNQQIFIRVKKQMAKKSKEIYAEVHDICEMLQKDKFKDIEELTETKTATKELPNNMQGLKATLDEINEHMALLESNQCR